MSDTMRIGPSGNSAAFYDSGRKHTFEEAAWLSGLGLSAFEYSFGRGVSITDKTAELMCAEFTKYDIAISVHAPYYTNFANESSDMIASSIGYVLQSVSAVQKMGGNRVVFHPASCGKLTREKALENTYKNIRLLASAAHTAFDSVNDDYIICAETMGKNQQIGRVEEIVEICKLDEHLFPCYDFGHINSYMQGGLKTKDDYRRIIDYTFSELGENKTKNMHIHFSKIEYSIGGEVKHLTFADEKYGPDYEPLAQIIDEYRMTPVIICESRETMSDDALIMKNFHKNS